jgi:Retrotransposon gag protein
MALNYLEPALMDDYAIINWADDYSTFINHLCTNFGPFNMEADVENKLDKLWMKENHKIAKYIVSFSQLALKVQWGKAALQHTFYPSIPDQGRDRPDRQTQHSCGTLEFISIHRHPILGTTQRYPQKLPPPITTNPRRVLMRSPVNSPTKK